MKRSNPKMDDHPMQDFASEPNTMTMTEHRTDRDTESESTPFHPPATNNNISSEQAPSQNVVDMDTEDGRKSLPDYQHIQADDHDPMASTHKAGALKRTTSSAGGQQSRKILINSSQTNKFCSNKISTAKYNFFTFLPKFLFEQFRKAANIFFLFISLMQQIPGVSPMGRYTTALPLTFILTVSAIKEIIEDVKRHRADGVVNSRKVHVHRHNKWTEVRWKEVVVGDIVKIKDGAQFPADLVLLSSSEPQAMCYIETSNLDGETNLKLRQGCPTTVQMVTGESLNELRGVVDCEQPNKFLYEFVGNIRLSGKNSTGTDLSACLREAQPVGPDQILLRGACLKNTSWIYGLVIYTGHQSKLMLNSTSTPLKRSNVEIMTNTQILLLGLMLMVISLFCAIASHLWVDTKGLKHWYLFFKADASGFSEKMKESNFFYNILTFIILYNNLIPISLQVTLEMVKFTQAIFINWDVDMFHEKTNTFASARTSNLNEELGQIKFIFSDKTGTLTQNIMNFNRCTIAGVVYGHGSNEMGEHGFDDDSLLENLRNNHETAPHISDFLTMMAVCHTVVPQINHATGEIQYLASSPDEAALVKAARKLGHVFTTRTPDYVEIEAMGTMVKYEILSVLEFTSKRKRMSVIVRDEDNNIKLFTKGADNVIFERLAPNSAYLETTESHLEEFASLGLRTLCIATAEINPDFYDEWSNMYYKASTALQDREQKLEEAAELIETNLRLTGATAIEDKLQDGVPDTIDTLAKADIKIWVLTGDKQETAINIGYSCKLLTQGMDLIIINEESLDETRTALTQHKSEFGEQLGKENLVGFIIDGQSLKYALSHDCRQDFLDIALSCRAVICCRVSPLQKAELVDLVKVSQKAITLAIGDGANDVGMIQAAHVGVGISGEEGMQASCASDYSIAQFRFLKKLLLVHGAWSYSRVVKLILYSFYKNICLYVIQFWFQLNNGYSGQLLFERWTLGLYNVVFTAAPPLAMGLFDRYCSADTMMKNPVLYKDSQSGVLFNVMVFWNWILNAVFHSVVLFWMTVAIVKTDSGSACFWRPASDSDYSQPNLYSFTPESSEAINIAFSNGQVGDYLFLGNFVYTYVVVTVCLKAGLETVAWTWLTHLTIWGSIVSWFGFLIVYSHIYPTLKIASEMVGQVEHVFGCSLFWLGLIIIPCSALFRDLVWKVLRREFFKTTRQSVQELELAHKENKIESTLRKRFRPISERARLLSRNIITLGDRVIGLNSRSSPNETYGTSYAQPVQHGFAFSQEENGAVNQAEYIRAYDSRCEKPGGY